jgi:hypothetical protein
VTVSLPKSTDSLAAPVSTGVHRKPKADLYTVLLVIALVAVLIGIVFLYLEMQAYDFKFQGGPTVVSNQPSEVRGCRVCSLSLTSDPTAEHGCSTSKTS